VEGRVEKIEFDMQEQVIKSLTVLRQKFLEETKELKRAGGDRDLRLKRIEIDLKPEILESVATLSSALDQGLVHANDNVAKLSGQLGTRMHEVKHKLLTQDGRIEGMEDAIRDQLFSQMSSLHEGMVQLEVDVSENMAQSMEHLERQVERKTVRRLGPLHETIDSLAMQCDSGASYVQTVAAMLSADSANMQQSLLGLNTEFHASLDRLDDLADMVANAEIDALISEYAAQVRHSELHAHSRVALML
jgi:hypothetical protein